MTTEPDHSNHQANCPGERAGPGPDATIPAAGADLSPYLAGTPTNPKANAPLTALPPDIQVGSPKETGYPSPTSTTRIASS